MDGANPTKENETTRANSRMTGHEWLNFICKSQEKEILRTIEKQPDLIERTFELECLAANVDEKCNCCYEFESLKHLSRDDQHFLSLVENRRCPHVVEDRSEINSLHEHVQDNSSNTPTYQNNITIKDMQFYSEETEHSPGTEKRYNDANNNNYKFQEPLDFNLLREAWMSLYLPSDRVMEGSGIVTAGVTLIHIASKLGYLKLVRKILKVADQSSHHTLHYRLLPLYHSIIYFKVDVSNLLIKMVDFGNKTNYTRYYVLAVIRNYIPILSLFVKCVTDFKPRNVPLYDFACMNYQKQLGSAIAVRYKCHQSLDFLCSKAVRKKFATQIGVYRIEGMPFMKWMEEEDLRTMAVDNDILSLSCLLTFRDLVGTLLEYTVFYDRKEMSKMLISEIKRRKRRVYTRHDFNVYSVAVLNNSAEMLHILLDGYQWLPRNIPQKFYTSHTWAVVLGFQDCVNVLQNTDIPYQKDLVARFPPLVAVFHKAIDSHTNNRIKLINILLSNGWSLSCESDNGMTPLYMAMQAKLYDFVRPLLRFGIDPFTGISCIPAFISRRFLAELLYANVDIFKRHHGISLLKEILRSSSSKAYKELQPDLCFFLRHSHTVPKEDLVYLSSVREIPHIPETLQIEFDNFLRTPRTLEALSRDSIRRHYGPTIGHFVTYQVPDLAKKIKSIIMLENNLQPYLGLSYNK